MIRSTSVLFVVGMVLGTGSLASAQEPGPRPPRFEKIDRNGDGSISREEWDAAAARLRARREEGGPEGRPEGRRPQRGRGEGKPRPEGGRPEGSGRLRERLRERARGGRPEEGSSRPLFDRLDRNGNGSLEKEELSGLRERLKERRGRGAGGSEEREGEGRAPRRGRGRGR